MDTLWFDIRCAARGLLRGRGYAVVAIGTVALSIGAATAMFSVVNHTLLRELPYPTAARVSLVWGQRPAAERQPLSYPTYADIRSAGVFERTAAWSSLPGMTMALSSGALVVEARYGIAGAELLDVLGVAPQIGRWFTPEQDRGAGAAVVVLGHALWSSRFGARRDVVGSTVRLEGRPFTVIGVLPRWFRFGGSPEPPDLWIPLAQDPLGGAGPRARTWARGVNYLGVAGLLRSDGSAEHARAELERLGQKLSEEYAYVLRDWRLRTESLTSQHGVESGQALLVLLGAVLVMLISGCANLAGLTLVRGSSRMRELTLRLALGASRARLVRQLATEASVVAAVGAASGLLVAQWLVLLASKLQRTAPSVFVPHTPHWADAAVDARVVGFACALAAVTALLLGVLPALRTSRDALHARLASGGRATAERALGRSRRTLVTAQVALAVVLVTGAGLLYGSVRALLALPLGFAPNNIVIADVAISREHDAAAAAAILEQWRDLVASRPEVEAAALAEQVPLAGGHAQTDFRIEGAPPATAAEAPKTEYSSIGPDYFGAVGARILRGRDVRATDRQDGVRVAVVNEAFVRQYFGAADPIGRRVGISVEALRFMGDGPPVLDFERAYRTIVGVVGDVRQSDLRTAPAPALYVPFAQRPVRRATLVVRSPASADAVHRLADAALRQVAPAQPLGTVRTLDTLLGAAVGDAATRARLLAAFALGAGLFALLGLYGVVAFAVARRTRELGIRLVVGASPASLMWLVTRDALLATAAGLGSGLLLAATAATLARRLLFGIEPIDSFTYAGVAVALGLTALLASLAPALRVTRIRVTAVLSAE